MMNGIIFVLCCQASIRAARAEEEVRRLSQSANSREAKRTESLARRCYYTPPCDSMSAAEAVTLGVAVVVGLLMLVGLAIASYPGSLWSADSADELEMTRTYENFAQLSEYAEGYVDTTAVEREADAMVNAMEAGEIYFVQDLYIDGLPTRSFHDVDQEGKRYRNWVKQDIMVSAYNGDAAREAYESAPTSELLGVTGAVLEWRDYGLLIYKLRARYWLVDQDGDGTWDWAARYQGEDENSDFVFLSADGATPKFDGAEAIELSDDWSGTTADIERMFKLSRSLDNLLCN